MGDILSVLKAGSLLIFDKGYINFTIFNQLAQAKVKFITRAKTNLVYHFERAIVQSASVHDYLVWIGKEETCQKIRLIEVQYRGKWYRYMTNELDDKKLPTAYVVALYWQRWRIEYAYNIVKRLLAFGPGLFLVRRTKRDRNAGLVYLAIVCGLDRSHRCGGRSFVQAFFSNLHRDGLSQSLLFYNARQRGETDDIVTFLANKANLLGILKRKHKEENPSPLIFIPMLLTGFSNP